MQYSVDAILLTYKPGKQVMELIEALEKQRYPIRKIIIMNTEERYFYNLLRTGFLEKYKNIEIHHLSEREFDHGRTESEGSAVLKGRYLCVHDTGYDAGR